MNTATPDPRFRLARSNSGLGLFARVHLRAGLRLIEYTGERITSEEADRRGGRYLFHVNGTQAIDAKGRDNLARYINHACRPNAEARVVGRRIFIYAKRAIEPGEEITYHYGPVYFRTFIKPAGCRCPTCLRRAERAKAQLAHPSQGGKPKRLAKTSLPSATHLHLRPGGRRGPG
jgi:uncharacterized protein